MMNDIANPFDAPRAHTGGAVANAEALRAATEVQSALVIAHTHPRDQKRAMDLIIQECTDRKSVV